MKPKNFPMRRLRRRVRAKAPRVQYHCGAPRLSPLAPYVGDYFGTDIRHRLGRAAREDILRSVNDRFEPIWPKSNDKDPS